MDNIEAMEVLHGFSRLIEEAKGLWLRKAYFGVLVIKQISIFCVFHDHVDAILVNEGVPELYDVRMV